MSEIKVVIEDKNLWPTRAHPNDAGLDLKCKEGTTLKAGETKLIGTGVMIEIPVGYVGLLVPRSGSPIKLANTIGIIDSDYRGEVRCKVENVTNDPIVISKLSKFAQLVIIPCLTPTVILVNKLSDTGRGDKGFGHSGK